MLLRFLPLTRWLLLSALVVFFAFQGLANAASSDPGKPIRVKIIAPASKAAPADRDAILHYLKKHPRLLPIVSSTLYGSDLLYANSDEARAADLVNALMDESKIVWCVRGGYGSSRLIPYLEKLADPIQQKIKDNPHKKIVIGYSDITALHLYLQKKYRWPTLHAPMLAEIINNKVDQRSIEQLMDLVVNNRKAIRVDGLVLINPQQVAHYPASLKNLQIASTVVGGNLTLVENSIGTVWQVALKNKILLLEDVSVSPAALERSLDHLQQAGILAGVRAVIFGDFTDCVDSALLALVQKRFASAASYPVFVATGIGHGYTKIPLPLNTHAIIQPHRSQEGRFSLTLDNLYQS